MGATPQVANLSRPDLERVGAAVPGVLSAVVLVARPGRKGKRWHLPYSRERSLDSCRFAPAGGPGAPMRLIDVLPDICSHCRCRVALPAPQAALWQACAEVVRADRHVHALDETQPRTWLGYARGLAASCQHQDEQIRSLLAPWLADQTVGDQARTVLAAWARVRRADAAALAAFRRDCPGAELSVAVGTACHQVLKGHEVREQSSALARAVRGGYGWTVVPHQVVGRAWHDARAQGACPDVAERAAMTALEGVWGIPEVRVRDVSALAGTLATQAQEYSSPAQWADAEFEARWRSFVGFCCHQLEEALRSVQPRPEGLRLLLVDGWPLVADADRDLAFLAQWPPVGAKMPTQFDDSWYEDHGSHRDFWRHTGYETGCAVVLAVPEYAAERALQDGLGGRIVAGPSLPQGQRDMVEAEARGLLRRAYPLLADDLACDGPDAVASPLVRQERASARQLLINRTVVRAPGEQKRPSEPDPEWERFLTARRPGVVWVPGNDEPVGDRALDHLPELRPGLFGDLLYVRVHAETGPRSAPELHALYGRLVEFDLAEQAVILEPAGAPRLLQKVPVHRLVALSRPRETARGSSLPLFEPHRSFCGPRG
ncbi:hypothetical protein [Streptomyces sp. NPDC058385]|uniref:hypothetical protein n=1 Tax=Streptomyces sp. NPDC058385 TaxID=3346473 RepID=UPI003666B0EE